MLTSWSESVSFCIILVNQNRNLKIVTLLILSPMWNKSPPLTSGSALLQNYAIPLSQQIERWVGSQRTRRGFGVLAAGRSVSKFRVSWPWRIQKDFASAKCLHRDIPRARHMAGAPSARGCDGCRKQKKKVGRTMACELKMEKTDDGMNSVIKANQNARAVLA